MTEILLATVFFTLVVLMLSLVVIWAQSVLRPSRRVSVVVNSQRTLKAQTGQKLLDILRDAGIPVPSTCAGVGTCGLCRVIVKEGGGTLLATETARLTKRERREGTRLACQVTVRDDTQVEVPDYLMGVGEFECTVVEAELLSPLIRRVVLALPQGQDFEFRAGAYVQVTAPAYRLALRDIAVPDAYRDTWKALGVSELESRSNKPVTRAYSIATTPAESGQIVLLVRLAVPPPGRADAPVGVVSSFLFGLEPGDKVAVSGPYGTFGARPGEREMIFIGGGVGMAPLRAIIFDELVTRKTERRMSFWYGARSRIDLFQEHEFEQLAAGNENFNWTVALSDPAPDDAWAGPTGFIHAVVYEQYLKTHPAPEDCEYYLCGPPLMIQAVLSMLEECGVDDDSIFFDDFGSSPYAAD